MIAKCSSCVLVGKFASRSAFNVEQHACVADRRVVNCGDEDVLCALSHVAAMSLEGISKFVSVCLLLDLGAWHDGRTFGNISGDLSYNALRCTARSLARRINQSHVARDCGVVVYGAFQLLATNVLSFVRALAQPHERVV